MIVNEHGQIIADEGITWNSDGLGLHSLDPRGYYIQLLDNYITWCLFRKTRSSYQEVVPYIKQILTTGSLSHCIRVAEIYEIKRVI